MFLSSTLSSCPIRSDFPTRRCVRAPNFPIMTNSVLSELNTHRHKIPKFEKACESSKSSSKKRVLKLGELEDDEYIRQYSMFYYQFKKTEGFAIDWEQFDYVFDIRSFDSSQQRFSYTTTVVRETTLLAIQKHNEANGTNLAFVDHVEANYTFTSSLFCWLTFWAIDMNSSRKEPKIYQAKVRSRGLEIKIFIFRLKPTGEKIASVDVEPPSPIYDDNNEPAVVFARAGPEDDHGIPFVFRRIEAGLDP